jgi:hypothetical protein
MNSKTKKTTKRVAPFPNENIDETNNQSLKVWVPLTPTNYKSNEAFPSEKSTLTRDSISTDFGKSFAVYCNRMMEHSKTEKASHLVSIADLTSSSASDPLGILITTFGFEQEFINYLFDISKVLNWFNKFDRVSGKS